MRDGFGKIHKGFIDVWFRSERLNGISTEGGERSRLCWGRKWYEQSFKNKKVLGMTQEKISEAVWQQHWACMKLRVTSL